MQIQRVNVSPMELVTLSALKEHMRIEHDAEDSLLKSLQRAAYDWVEQFTCRSLLTTQWKFSSLPLKGGSEIRLALPLAVIAAHALEAIVTRPAATTDVVTSDPPVPARPGSEL